MPTCSNQNSIIKTDEGYFLSIYDDELTKKNIVVNVAKVKAAFPQLSVEFLGILSDRFIEKKFTDKRMFDAVNYVIDNCTYPNPTIANFLTFDKRRKLYTYNEVCDLVAGGEKMENFQLIEVDGKKWRIKKTELK